MDLAAFKEATGAGVVVTEEQITEVVNAVFEANKAEIMDKKHDFNFVKLQGSVKEKLKWADGGMVRNKVEAKKLELIGEKPAEEGKKKKKKEEKKGDA